MGSRVYLAGSSNGVIMNNQQMLRDFDSVAASWDQEPRRVQLARKVVDAISCEARPLQAMRVLDFWLRYGPGHLGSRLAGTGNSGG